MNDIISINKKLEDRIMTLEVRFNELVAFSRVMFKILQNHASALGLLEEPALEEFMRQGEKIQ